MKMPLITVPLLKKGTTTVKSPTKICMHVLRSARNDVRVIRAASTFLEEGFTVSVIDVDIDALKAVEEINGVCLSHLRIPGWHTTRHSQLRFFITSVRAFVQSLIMLFKSQADIYHANELTALPASFIVAKLRNKPLIYEAYELHVPVPETDVEFWRRLGKLLMWFFAMVLPRCAGVITTTPLYAEVMQKRFHIPEVTVIRNIPPYRTVEKTDLLREHLGLSRDIRIALYQGGLQRNRGLDKLVRATAFLEDGNIIILMGKGMGTTQEELEELIVSEGIADRIKIIPPVPRYEDLLDWTASADIGLIIYTPDYSLAVKMILPNKLFEYIMAGVPVLATELDAVVDVIRTNNVGRIVASVAPADIGAAINTMLADRAALAEMQRNALEAAQREFHWEMESKKFVHLYRDILANQARHVDG